YPSLHIFPRHTASWLFGAVRSARFLATVVHHAMAALAFFVRFSTEPPLCVPAQRNPANDFGTACAQLITSSFSCILRREV
ncbi:MAG TPA: hypothetical protein PK493_10375, partial [Pseudomonadota bacterium]|nr:hypothetical protein [Pseudomonadota bacterium]